MYTGGCLHCTFDKSALFQQIKTKCWYNNPGRNWRVKPVPKRESCSVGKSSEWSCCEVIWNMPRSRGHGCDLSGAHRNSQHLSAKEAGCLDRGRPGLPRRRRLFFSLMRLCGKRRKHTSTHLVLYVSLPFMCLHSWPTPNICVVVHITSFVSGNFHSAYESYRLANFSTIWEFSLSKGRPS